eukprot:476631-Lingulodinium_polyedra.AAC.1
MPRVFGTSIQTRADVEQFVVRGAGAAGHVRCLEGVAIEAVDSRDSRGRAPNPQRQFRARVVFTEELFSHA